MSISKNDIIQLLNASNIEYSLFDHKPIYTVADGAELHLSHADVIAKTLFLCDDKREKYYLISLLKDKQLNLKELREAIKSRRLSFASESDLNNILGISAGAVTPLGILNDDKKIVEIIFDKSFMNGLIGIPLNENTSTVFLKANDLFQLINRHGNKVQWIELKG